MKSTANGMHRNQLLQRLFTGVGLVLGLAATVSTGALKAEGLTTDSSEHLLVGTVDNYLPCSDEANNNYEGLSIDVWRRVAENINRPYTIVSLPTFSQAVDAAAFGSVDLIASCHKITPERLELVEFSVPYTRDSLGMLKESLHSLVPDGAPAALVQHEHDVHLLVAHRRQRGGGRRRRGRRGRRRERAADAAVVAIGSVLAA